MQPPLWDAKSRHNMGETLGLFVSEDHVQTSISCSTPFDSTTKSVCLCPFGKASPRRGSSNLKIWKTGSAHNAAMNDVTSRLFGTSCLKQFSSLVYKIAMRARNSELGSNGRGLRMYLSKWEWRFGQPGKIGKLGQPGNVDAARASRSLCLASETCRGMQKYGLQSKDGRAEFCRNDLVSDRAPGSRNTIKFAPDQRTGIHETFERAPGKRVRKA